jgi:amino acid transporter
MSTWEEAMGGESGKLRANAVGAVGAAAIAMAFMGPATSVNFNTAPGAAQAGYGLPLGTLLALLICLALAFTIGSFSRRMPTAGFAYTFNTAAFGRAGGFISGWTLAFAYLAVGPMLFAALGSFGHSWLETNLSIDIPWWLLSLVVIGLVFTIGSRGLDRSAETAIVFLAIEVTVMTVLCITILVNAHHLSLAPFAPSSSLHGFTGIRFGMLWGVLMFVGFEMAATLGEETHDPRRGVPRALFIAVGTIGVFYVLASYCAAVGFGAGAGSRAFATNAAPWTTLADNNWGTSLAWIMTLVVIFSQFANSVAGSNGAVRILFSLGRERLLPSQLARTNASGSPIGAWTFFIALSTLITLALGFAMGPLNVYDWMGTLLGLGICLVYIAVNLALVVWMWRFSRQSFSWWKHGLIPIVASLLLTQPIWGQLHPYPPYPFSLVPPLLLTWIVGGIAYFLYLRSRAPHVIKGMGHVWVDAPDAPVDSTAQALATAASVGAVES